MPAKAGIQKPYVPWQTALVSGNGLLIGGWFQGALHIVPSPYAVGIGP